ncbi:MAG: MMPL family transporter, partial [Solirubrobacteraceae bacterium]
SSTGRVITAAATIMVLVFLWFVLIHERIAQEFGLSLAGAVFLDAFVVCGLLLPAVLELIGAATWKLPHRIERRLPKVAIEPDPLEEPNPRSARPAFREAPRPILVASSRPAPRDWARCGHGDRFCDADL